MIGNKNAHLVKLTDSEVSWNKIHQRALEKEGRIAHCEEKKESSSI